MKRPVPGDDSRSPSWSSSGTDGTWFDRAIVTLFALAPFVWLALFGLLWAVGSVMDR